MAATFAQGTDVPLLLSNFVNFTLNAGDTVRGQFRYALGDPLPLAEIGVGGVTGVVDVAAQTVLVTIPEAVNTLWRPAGLSFTVYTTLLIVGADGQHRLAIELATDWRASYTRGAGV